MNAILFRIAIAFVALGLCSCAPKPKTFNVIVFDTTNKRDVHRERVTLARDSESSTVIKLIYQTEGLFEDGLQFTLSMHPDNQYEAFISPVPRGKIISSGKMRTNARLIADWNGTSYMYLIEPL